VADFSTAVLSIAGVESSIASVAEIFTLQGDDRMRELERRFLP
jgi:hypothetical protein